MPPRRSSISSSTAPNGAGAAAAASKLATPRRTGRQSITPTDAAAAAQQKKAATSTTPSQKPGSSSSTSKKPPVSSSHKRARSVSVAPVFEDDDQDESAPKTKKIKPVPRPKPQRAPVQGMNTIPSRYDPFPLTSSFDFELVTPVPSPELLPRTAFVFGNGDFGQHGIGLEGGTVEIVRPRLHVLLEKLIGTGGPEWKGGVASLECGGMHTLCVDGAGRIWSWGINDNAALGRVTAVPGQDSEELETQPMLVEGLDFETFKTVKVAAGDSVSLAISETGELRCWGSFRHSEGLLGFDGVQGASKTQLTPVALKNLEAVSIVQVATGDDHFVALTTKGTVFACGNGEQCQLGRKIIQRHKTHGLTPERLALKNIVLVGSGSYHSFAVDANGEVYAWGLNSFHQTGVSDDDGGWQDTITTPIRVAALHPSAHGGAKVVQIVGGPHHTIFLLSNGEVWGCGRCDGSEMGLGSEHTMMKEMKKRELEALKRRKAYEVACRARIAANKPEDDDEVNPGQPLSELEIDLKAKEEAAQTVPLPNPFIPEPTKIEVRSSGSNEEEKIVQVAVGTRANFAVTRQGKLFAWGFGNVAQLGLGDEEEVEKPTQVVSKAMGGFRVLHAAAGGQHSVVVAIRGSDAKPSLYVEKVDAE